MNRRAARARELIARYPEAAEILEFYASVVCTGQTAGVPELQARIEYERAAELRSSAVEPKPGMPPTCTKCGELPVAGILRQDEHSARKSFLCSACHHEWNYHRILCPKCGEDGFEKLPVYTAAEFPHLRVDACDTCKTYLLAVDLTKDPRAVPVVDEIAAVALNLWAQEKGYSKIQPNLFGI